MAGRARAVLDSLRGRTASGKPLASGTWSVEGGPSYPWRSTEEPTDEGVIWRVEVEGPAESGVEAVMALLDAYRFGG